MNADNTQITDLAEVRGDYPHLETTRAIIGAAYEAHGELGPGFLEKVYENALAQELSRRGITARQQAEVTVHFKATESLSSAHEAQILHYLKATGIKVGLLLNFGSQRVQVKRFARTR